MNTMTKTCLSGCCNQKVFDHLPAACQQRSDVVGQGGFLKNKQQQTLSLQKNTKVAHEPMSSPAART